MVLTESWPGSDLPLTIHGTSIAYKGRAVVMVGPSGSGKSSLALQLMALGAGLISDDLTRIALDRDGIRVSRPPQTTAPLQIEARGIGILPAAPAEPTRLHLLIDMSEAETQRLPEKQYHIIATHRIRTFRRVDNPAFPAMVLHYLNSGQG